MYILQLLMGIVGAINFPAWDAWFTNMQDDSRKGSSFALMHGTNNIGRGLAALVGGAIAFFISFQMLFAMSGLFVLLSTIFLFGLEENVSA